MDEPGSQHAPRAGGAGHCCAPARSGAGGAPAAGTTAAGAPADGSPGVHRVEQARVPAGVLEMGDARGDQNPGDGEVPVHPVRLSAFEIDATTVTVADFAAFVAATGYVTDAESFGFSAVFHLLLDEGVAGSAAVVGPFPGVPWWVGVRGADWRRPGGRVERTDELADHPVTHVSWHDALAYCRWAGRTLPSEAQWELASRGGLVGARYPWGDDLLTPDGAWRCNIWQGRFPTVNACEDGYLGTAPARSYEPNGYGLWQTVGNVWEWTADAWDPHAHHRRARAAEAAGEPLLDPVGGASAPLLGDLLGGGPQASADVPRVTRGGSFLCHDSYCNRYRNAARTQNTPDSSSSNTGFRTVAVREDLGLSG
ncbi:SUMF1/EgtB/PvdO family nonheme iron enzyme [Nocardioides sp. GY 10127]|uniref:SUMF1/EgtB/PvdO family nonheme iron enzyme n=1 Tax=Nocardioides sp. GY 10127 TaxID=2569762 RepID=UPI0010A8DB5F|nr:SUMF1/EgtB/PvdO family nonheme iron enzyme [Nocardioides sp. GY 10127]TIC84471.1 formylglycine-generating enzyme family protein [Nocardioides sp. GY 10127]